MVKIDLSIVIVSYNTKKVTEDCIESINRSLTNTKIKYEIVLVDNDSRDGSAQALQKIAQNKVNQLSYSQTGSNLGFGRGNNFGVKKAVGKYILLLNTDTIVLNRAIEKLYNFYVENEKEVHFLGAKLLNLDLTPQPSACRFFTLPVVFATLLLKGDYWGLTRSSPDKFCQVDWISRLGGFDKNIFMYMEEVDLLYRAKKLGLNTFFYPASQIIHLGSASSNGKTFPILQVYKGFLFFYKKHYSIFHLFALRLILKFKALIAYLIGKIRGNQYLIKTYEEAFKLA
ncbi:MAG: Glycosyltransferase/rhamnosyltransferase [Candidatus Roizmanbacteria bacterium GW2011_GWC2_34_23]|uniref:Glycosyltransferase/rhamnosyltransferase n=1 Tax=Candidatus Roizmanbacteria bacterium GW2011_GWC2_34_23 TaxID=1618484 RepID=A0A0G0DCF0_9BACT|nr:MAG: Glycosyltransferase/rhamnosyltransferase [Candidatus Roizmanbacteria bacterium GW2011_GWC2_34_23]